MLWTNGCEHEVIEGHACAGWKEPAGSLGQGSGVNGVNDGNGDSWSDDAQDNDDQGIEKKHPVAQPAWLERE